MPINNFSKLIFKFKKIIISSFLVLIFVNVTTSCNTTTEIKDKVWIEDFVENKEYSEFINKAETYLREKKFSGTILVSKGQDILFAKGYGLNDKKNPESPHNTMHTTYEIGAITKQFTAAAILQLVESGDISLDDKLSKYFPGYKYGNDITIEMLLSNRSGILDHLRMPYEFFPSEIARDIDKASIESRNGDIPRYIVIHFLYDAPLYAKPGTTYIECNTDYYILGVIIEQVTGMKYEDYIEKYIFQKINMCCSNLNYQETTAKGYDYKGRFYSIPKGLSLGCDDMNTCVIDLFKWNYALSHGEIVSHENFKRMIENNYGTLKDNKSYRQTGITDVFNSYNQYYTDYDVSIIVLSNEPISDNSATIIANSLNRMFMEYIKDK